MKFSLPFFLSLLVIAGCRKDANSLFDSYPGQYHISGSWRASMLGDTITQSGTIDTFITVTKVNDSTLLLCALGQTQGESLGYLSNFAGDSTNYHFQSLAIIPFPLSTEVAIPYGNEENALVYFPKRYNDSIFFTFCACGTHGGELGQWTGVKVH